MFKKAWLLARFLLLVYRWPQPHCDLTCLFPQCSCITGVSSSSYKETSPITLGSYLSVSFNFNCLLKSPISKYSHIGVRSSRYGFFRDTTQFIALSYFTLFHPSLFQLLTTTKSKAVSQAFTEQQLIYLNPYVSKSLHFCLDIMTHYLIPPHHVSWIHYLRKWFHLSYKLPNE
jgi:hypothetical protein